MDYTLMVAGSSFTVGVAEEECDTASVTEMADTTASRSANPESNQYAADRRESSHVTTNHPDSSSVMGNRYESSHVSADLPKSLPVIAGHPESCHVTADIQSLFTSPLTIQSLSMSPLTIQSLITSQLICQSHHISADLPVSSRLS